MKVNNIFTLLVDLIIVSFIVGSIFLFVCEKDIIVKKECQIRQQCNESCNSYFLNPMYDACIIRSYIVIDGGRENNYRLVPKYNEDCSSYERPDPAKKIVCWDVFYEYAYGIKWKELHSVKVSEKWVELNEKNDKIRDC